MIYTILLANLLTFVPLILFTEFFRGVDEYCESNSIGETVVKGYLPYLFLFLLVNSITLLFVFSVNVYKSFSEIIQFILLFADVGMSALSIPGILISLLTNKWRGRYGIYTTRVSP